MATRFYFEPTIAAAVNPAFDAGWEQTGQAVRRAMRYKATVAALTALTDSAAITVPITTTQDILCYQFVSAPMPPRRIIGTCSFVMRCLESATTANVNLAAVLKAVNQDGGTVFGTLFSTFGTDTEFAITTADTRFWITQALTALSVDDVWRLVLEVGAHAAAPSAGTTYTMRAGFSSATDLAYSTAVATDNNPSLELSEDLFGTVFNNAQSVDVGDGMSTSEKIR
jgi:hypothetical protein